MKKGIVIVIVMVLIVLVGFLIFNIQANKGTSSQTLTGQNEEKISVQNIAKNNIIEITSSGFSPQTLSINQGESVTFVNKDSQKHWPASAVHPTHTVYPGSDKKKCGTLEQSKIFDACKGLAQGEEFSFIFNEKGSWNYHDHLSASFKGIIVVN